MAYPFPGRSGPAALTLTDADITFFGEAAGDEAASVIEGTGDLDGNGLADLGINAGKAGATDTPGYTHLLYTPDP